MFANTTRHTVNVNNNKRRFGQEWKVFLHLLPAWTWGMLTSWNVIWLSLELGTAEVYCGKDSNTKWNERQHFDERSFFAGTTCPLRFLSENTILEMIRNLKNDQYQFIVDRYQLSLVIIHKKEVNKTRNYQSMSKDNNKVEWQNKKEKTRKHWKSVQVKWNLTFIVAIKT